MKWSDKESVERLHPIIISVSTLALLFILFLVVPCNIFPFASSAFDNVIGVIVTSTSILIGFIGVLLALLVGVRESALMVELFKIKDRGLLKKYFSSTIMSGFFLLILSILLYLRDWVNLLYISESFYTYNLLVILWVSLIVYVVLVARRIVNIMMVILFKSDKLPSVDSIKMEESEAEEFGRRYRRSD